MGKANTSVNQWLRDNHRFASLYNGYVFGGRQIITWSRTRRERQRLWEGAGIL